MDRFVIEIKAELGNNGDFHLQRDYLTDAAVMLMGFNTLIDFIKTRTVLHKHAESILSQNQPSEDLWRAIGEVIEGDVRKAISSIYEGKLIIHFENTSRFIIMEPVPAMLDRSIDTPTNENVIKGALDSFTEGIDANIGIVRKLVNSEEIRIDSFSAGHSRKNKLSLLYIDGQADMDLVNSIRDNIKKNIQMDSMESSIGSNIGMLIQSSEPEAFPRLAISQTTIILGNTYQVISCTSSVTYMYNVISTHFIIT
ncbi:spore germination protein [Cytobacillus oceanisediminis]|uniref:spore germination protein n=1 Tax=Cytobacillus oceanisediminis TaxID=665099 RepID=UPI001CF15E91|nr:spore germination protein [Cytobacillus oceanisediminis]